MRGAVKTKLCIAHASPCHRIRNLTRRTCPLLTNTKVRRSLYLSLVKCHLDYATQVWSPALTSLKIKIENVQRRATRWILKQRKGEQSYKERLVTLKLLPLCYDREVKDLVFFYKAMRGYINLDVNNFVSFVTHGRTRLSEARTLKLRPAEQAPSKDRTSTV